MSFPIQPVKSGGGKGIGRQFVNRIIQSLNSNLTFNFPLHAKPTGNGLQVIHTRPHRFKWFGIVTQEDISEAAEQGVEISPGDIGIQKLQTKDCQGGDLEESSFSALCYPRFLDVCSQEYIKQYGQITRVFFPALCIAVPPTDWVHGRWNYDSGRWESDFRGPTQVAVRGTYVMDQVGPSTVDVYVSDGMGGMVDSEVDIEVHFDWSAPPNVDFTGEMVAQWFELDCKWRVICCFGEEMEAEECISTAGLDEDFSDDSNAEYLNILPEVGTDPWDSKIEAGKLLPGDTGGGRRYCTLGRCLDLDSWPIGGYWEAHADFGFDHSFDTAFSIEIGNVTMAATTGYAKGFGTGETTSSTRKSGSPSYLNSISGDVSDPRLGVRITKQDAAGNSLVEFYLNGGVFDSTNLLFDSPSNVSFTIVYDVQDDFAGNPGGLHDTDFYIDNISVQRSW